MNSRTDEGLQRLEEICRARGLPLTHQRRIVLEVLLQRADHPSADQVYEAVSPRIPRISRRTVYRVLDTLALLGLIRRVHHPGAVARFDAHPDRHHHLVCMQCDRIVDWENSDLDRMALPPGRPHGFDIRDFTVQFLGVCPECRKKQIRKGQS